MLNGSRKGVRVYVELERLKIRPLLPWIRKGLFRSHIKTVVQKAEEEIKPLGEKIPNLEGSSIRNWKMPKKMIHSVISFGIWIEKGGIGI